MTRDSIQLFRTLHRRLSNSDRAVEVQAAQVVEVTRRLLLLGKIEALHRMAESGADELVQVMKVTQEMQVGGESI